MKHKILGLIVVALTCTAFAQTGKPDTPGTNATTTTTQRTEDESPHRDYGWIGLLGLAGLAGLRKHDHTHTVNTTPSVRR